MSDKFGHEKSNSRDKAKKVAWEAICSRQNARAERIKFNQRRKKRKEQAKELPSFKPAKRCKEDFPDHVLTKQKDGSLLSHKYVFHQSRWRKR